jgi:glycosyltransferase 2 family protein
LRLPWRALLAVGLSVGLTAALIRGLEGRAVLDLLRGTDPRWVGASFAVYATTYLLRALRWRVLLGRAQVSIATLLPISAVHILLNNVLPSRLGEVSYPVLLKRQTGLGLDEGVVTLALSRLLDLLTLAAIFLVAVVWVGQSPGTTLGSLPVLALSAAFALLVLLAGLRPLAALAHRAVARGARGRGRTGAWLGRLAPLVARVREAIERSAGLGPLLAGGVLTLGIWAGKFLAFTWMVRAMAPDGAAALMGFWSVVLGSTAAELTTLTPFHGVVGLGTYETAWAGVFVLALGVDRQSAVLTGFGVHGLTLVFSFVLGGLGLLALRRETRGAAASRG